jgi:hypothetical protein
MPHVFDKSYYNFYFFPEALISYGNFGIARIRISYTIDNATMITQVGPRLFKYVVNPKIFKFEIGKSGPVLSDNTSLNIFLPQNAIVEEVIPLPDNQIPLNKNFTATYFVWNSGEPLSSFTLIFYIKQGMISEISDFVKSVHETLLKNLSLIVKSFLVLIILAIIYFYFKKIKQKQ